MFSFILLLGFYTIKDDTSSYISLLSYAWEEPKIELISENLSNSSDPCLSSPKNYKQYFNNNIEIYKISGECSEKISISRYYFSITKLHIIQISHEHAYYEYFLNIAGKRTLIVNNKVLGSYIFPITEIEKTINFELVPSEENRARDGSLLLSLNNWGRSFLTGTNLKSYYSIAETIHVIPKKRYLVNFKYLIPAGGNKGNQYLFIVNRYKDSKNLWQNLDPITIELKYDPDRVYYRNLETVIYSGEATSIMLSFRIVSSPDDDDNVGDMLIRDFTFKLIGARDKCP